jgi:hypothetical protein
VVIKMDAALLGAITSSAFSLAALVVSRVKCIYRRTEDGCQPACACSGQPLEHHEEDIEIRRVEIEGKEVVVLLKKSRLR